MMENRYAGIYFSKHFTDYTVDDLRSLVSVNVKGFLVVQPAGDQANVGSEDRRKHRRYHDDVGGSSDRGVNSAVPMITKGGLEAVTRSLAMEYVKQGMRVNAVAPGVVDTPMHKDDPKDFLKTLQPMGQISDVKDIVDAITYLADAGQVTGEVLYVDGGAHVGKW